MKFICFTAQNLSLLFLSPYVKVSLDGGKAVFSQLMFRTAIQLEGKTDDLAECIRLLRAGVQHGELLQWGEGRFAGFPKWLERALRAGIVE